MITKMLASPWRRFALATVLWWVFWPLFYLIKLGDISGPQAFHWLIGVMNYPVVILVFAFADTILSWLKLRLWLVFTLSAAVAALSVPFYFHRVGFALGVFADAWLF